MAAVFEEKRRSASRNPRGQKSDDASAAPFGRVPPHSIDSEQALLACCIMDGGQESITNCVGVKLTPESFFKPAHQMIFKILLDLYNKGTPVDEIILSDELRAKNLLDEVGGIAYINEVTNRIDTPAHMPHYLSRVKDLALVRRLIRTSIKTIEEAYSDQENLDQFLEKVEQEVFSISEDRISDTAKPVKDSVEGAVNLINKMIQRKGELTGISTGFIDLDKLTFGFHPQEMIVVAARPSQGKTSIALNMAEAAILPADKNKAVATLVFSLEMSSEQLAMRLLCGHARADMQQLKDGFLSKEKHADLARSAAALKDAPLWIDDSGNLTILEMRAKARRLHAQKKLGLVIIDYLQLITGTDPRVPREQQIAEISRGIKAMAKELNVPVIVAAQLNRESEKEKRQPRISDLRESGSIEQDADIVLLISRKKDFDEAEEQTSSMLMRDLILAKQRNGPTGIVGLVFNKRITKFENYTKREDEE